jgi:hypothetical protein
MQEEALTYVMNIKISYLLPYPRTRCQALLLIYVMNIKISRSFYHIHARAVKPP